MDPWSYLSKYSFSYDHSASINDDSSWLISPAATGKGLGEKSIPFPRYFLIKFIYSVKVMNLSLSVSRALKIKTKSYLLGLFLIKNDPSVIIAMKSSRLISLVFHTGEC